MSGPGPFAAEPEGTSRELRRTWGDQPGWIGRITTVQNDIVGKRLLFCGFFFLLLGGSVDSVIMRIQLAVPDNSFVSPQLYNELFTNHGSVTMFLVILPIIEGFTILVLPFMLGSREMPFPRLGAYSFYTFLFGGLFYYSSALFGLVPDAGWFAYTPLSGTTYSPDLALDFWVLGLSVAEVGAIAAAIEIVIAILKMRTPGMTLNRLPMFAWAMLVTSIMILFAFTPLIVGSLLLELDRGFDMKFFVPEAGGSSLLWQHIFWIFGHPEVYIQYLPAVGVVATVLPVFTRRKIAGYSWMVGGFIAIGFLSFALWVHHMFTVGLPPIVESLFASASMLIAIPAGVQIVALVLTIWLGRPVWKTPFLFVVGFLLTFVIGGITGVMVAAVPFDDQAHDSYFVVGHLHYVLIGGVAFPMFAAAYYWLPKFSGRLLNERLGRINFWLLFIGMNVAFFPMHIVGLMGMPRRIYTYPAGNGWGIYNFISTVGVFIMLAGIATFLVNVVHSRYRGERSGPDPWEADTLEWSVTSPPPEQGFSIQPIVHGRHPLWDQNELHVGRPGVQALLLALSKWPTTWRAALVTNTTTAEPEEVFRPSGPSIWPFLTACATVAIFSGELLGQRVVVAGGVIAVCAGIAMWHSRDDAPDIGDDAAAFEAEHGIPLRTHGSRAISLAAMILVIVVAVIAFATMLLAYFYLYLENPIWPPSAAVRGSYIPPIVGTVAMVISAVAIQFAHWESRSGRRQRPQEPGGLRRRTAQRTDNPIRHRAVRAALLAAIVSAFTGIVVLVVELSGQGFGTTDHAYGSIFFTLSGFVVAVALFGLGLMVFILPATWKARYVGSNPVFMTNIMRFQTTAVGIWILGLATIYVSPAVT